MSTHHKHSGSRLGMRYLCPGSGHMEEGEPDNPTTASLEGEACHACLHVSPRSWPGIFQQLGVELAERHEQLIQGTIDRVFQLVPKGASMHWEYPLELWDNGKLLTAGTCDLLTCDHGRYSIFEFKFGRAVPNYTFGSLQLGAYAAAIFADHPDITKMDGYVYHARSQAMIELVLKRDEVLGIVKRAIRTAEDKGAKRHAGPIQCEYCRGLKKCPEARALAMSGIYLNWERETTDSDIDSIIPLLMFCKLWAGAMEDRVGKVLESGKTLKNAELVERPGRREIVDIDQAYHALRKIGMPADALLSVIKLPIGKLEVVFLGSLPPDERKAKRDVFWRTLQPFMRKAESSKVLTLKGDLNGGSDGC